MEDIHGKWLDHVRRPKAEMVAIRVADFGCRARRSNHRRLNEPAHVVEHRVFNQQQPHRYRGRGERERARFSVAGLLQRQP